MLNCTFIHGFNLPKQWQQFDQLTVAPLEMYIVQNAKLNLKISLSIELLPSHINWFYSRQVVCIFRLAIKNLDPRFDHQINVKFKHADTAM